MTPKFDWVKTAWRRPVLPALQRLAFIPFTVAALFFPSIHYLVSSSDGLSHYYGFPLPWNADSLVTSLAKTIFIMPLLLDGLFWAGLGYLLLQKMVKQPTSAVSVGITLLWLWALGCAVFLYVELAFNPEWLWWFDFGYYQTIELFLHLGT